MHVLVLPSWYSTSDKPWLGTFFADQAVALARAGMRVGVVFVENRSLRRISFGRLLETHFQKESSSSEGVTTLRMKGWNTLAQTLPGASVWSRLTEHLVNAYVDGWGKPDVIHAHSAFWAGHAAVRAAARLRIPCVVTEHGSDFLVAPLSARRRRRAAEIYRSAAAVLAVSTPLLRSVNAIAQRSLGPVVPNMVDTDFFTLPPRPRPSTPFTFLSVGNLVESKRVDLLIRAFARLFSRKSDIRLVIVGSGPREPFLRELARSVAAPAQVEFTGPLSREEVRARMWSSNALVLPSAFETFGVVLIEALATGLPVIATRCGGPEEILTGGVGLLIDSDQESQLSTALKQVMSRSNDETILRNHAIEHFGNRQVVSQLINVYKNILG
jgi:glycosyltransferase involved in cell wall biosynthesis